MRKGFSEYRKRAGWLTAAFAVLVSMALPVMSPYLTEKASAADEPSNATMLYGRDAEMTAGNSWQNPAQDHWLKTTCQASLQPGVLDNDSIQRALGLENFDRMVNMNDSLARDTLMKQGWSDSKGPLSEKTLMDYLRYLRSNYGNKQVKVLNFYQFNPQASGATKTCGGTQPGDPHFVLIPVHGAGGSTKPEEADTWIGYQLAFDRGKMNTSSVNMMKYVARGAAPLNGNNTVGTLTYMNTKVNRNNLAQIEFLTNGNFIVQNTLKQTGPVVTGNVSSATFIDAATIQLVATYTSTDVNGTATSVTIKDTYRDPLWDELPYYFLTEADSSLESRQRMTYGNNGGNARSNPYKDSRDPNGTAGSNRIPFIAVNGPPVNVCMTNGCGTATRFQQGINALGTQSVLFYDYNPDGTTVGKDPNIVGLPAPLELRGKTDSTRAKIWFYGSKAKNAMVTVFSNGSGNEIHYTGNYIFNDQKQRYIHGPTDCVDLGNVQPPASTRPDGTATIKWDLRQPGTQCINDYGTVDAWILFDETKYSELSQSVSDREGQLGDGSRAAELVCDVSGNPLTWFMCPLATAAQGLADQLDNAIMSTIDFDTDKYFGNTQTGQRLHVVWNSFRILGISLLVIVALIMVASQAGKLEVTSAYAFKKTMPRLAIAAIFIPISLPVVIEVIDASNVVTYGMRELLYAPFNGVNAVHIGGGASTVLALIGGGAFLALGILGFLSLALSAALAVAMGYAVLLGRHVIIVGLAVSISLWWAFNTVQSEGMQRAFKFLNGSLWKAIWIGPVLIFVVDFFHIAAWIFYTTAEGSLLLQLAAVVVYFGAYPVLIKVPAAFGGALASLTGFANDRSKGIFDRLRNQRSNLVQSNTKKMAEGRRFSDNIASRPFNRLTEGFATFAGSEKKWGFLTNADSRNAAFEQRRSIMSAEFANSAQGKVGQHNDGMNRALTYQGEKEARENMARDWNMNAGEVETAIQAAKQNGGWSRARQDNALRRLSASGTGYANYQQLHRAVARVVGDNDQRAGAILGEINSTTKNAGRHDLAAGVGNQLDLYREALASGGTLRAASVNAAVVSAIKGTDVVTAGRDKGAGMENYAEALPAALQVAINTGNNEEAARLTSIIEQFRQSGSYFAPQNTEIFSGGAYHPTAANRATATAMANEMTYIDRTSGAIFDAATAPRVPNRHAAFPGQPTHVLDPNLVAMPSNPVVREVYQDHRPAYYNPNDPNATP